MREVKTAGSDSMVVHSIAPVGSFCGDSSELCACACACVCVSFFKRVKKGFFMGTSNSLQKQKLKMKKGMSSRILGKKTLVHWTIHKKCH